MNETLSSNIDNRMIKLDLIRLVWSDRGDANTAVAEAQILYNYINSGDIQVTGEHQTVSMTNERLQELRRYYDEKVAMGSSA